jgi:FkbM family methyltransferase
MSIRVWLSKRSARRRDKKYKPLREAFDRAVAGLTSSDVAIDCGANQGLYTLRMAGSGAEVHAFEPNPVAFEELSSATAACPNVKLYQAAVTTEPGHFNLYLHKRAKTDPVYYSTGSSLLAEKPNVREDRAVRVEGIQLSRFIRELGRPVKLLKMDIEGAEVDVLNQILDEGLESSIGQAFVEVHDRSVPALVEPTQKLRERLEELGASHIRLDWR